MEKRPNCYKCAYRRTIPGDCHSRCANISAIVAGNHYGIANNWFNWPENFDPTWLLECNGFVPKE